MVTTLDLPRKCNILSSTSLPQHQWLARPSSFPTLLNSNNHKKVNLQLLSPTFIHTFELLPSTFFHIIFGMYFFSRIFLGGIKIRWHLQRVQEVVEHCDKAQAPWRVPTLGKQQVNPEIRYKHLYLEPVCPLVLKALKPPKEGPENSLKIRVKYGSM